MTPSTQPIRFFHRGRIVDVSGVHPTRSVLDWLREDARCTGTKEGCNEGDCGACTVVIGELADAGEQGAVGGLRLQTVNACIQFLPTLHGKALFTVEDLKAQCGHGHERAAARQASGAAPASGAAGDGRLPRLAMRLLHAGLRDVAVVHLRAPPGRRHAADAPATGRRPLGQPVPLHRLPADPRRGPAHVRPARCAPRHRSPWCRRCTSLQHDEHLRIRRAAGPAHGPLPCARPRWPNWPRCAKRSRRAQLLAGSTDVGLWVNKQFRDLGDIIFVGDVAEMKTRRGARRRALHRRRRLARSRLRAR